VVIVTADHETGGFTLGAALVPVFAYGPGAENFMGVYENTEIFNKLVLLLESE